jgi:hypothetical protein
MKVDDHHEGSEYGRLAREGTRRAVVDGLDHMALLVATKSPV